MNFFHISKPKNCPECNKDGMYRKGQHHPYINDQTKYECMYCGFTEKLWKIKKHEKTLPNKHK